MPMKFILSAVLIVASASTYADVSVQINNQQFHYMDAPRLAEILEPVSTNKRWYWPAAALYRLDSQKPEQIREKALIDLQQLSARWQEQPERKATVLRLIRELESWQLAERIPVAVDYDLARVKPEFNPRLEYGRYLLRLKTRPDAVYAYGVITYPQRLAHQGATPAYEYLQGLTFSAGADSRTLYVIQPDGRVQLLDNSYWNRQHLEIMPGGQLFIPFADEWFSSLTENINQQIAELATHRVMP